MTDLVLFVYEAKHTLFSSNIFDDFCFCCFSLILSKIVVVIVVGTVVMVVGTVVMVVGTLVVVVVVVILVMVVVMVVV